MSRLNSNSKELIEVIMKRVPGLSPNQAQSLAADVVDVIAEQIAAGKSISFFHMSSNGQNQIIELALEKNR